MCVEGAAIHEADVPAVLGSHFTLQSNGAWGVRSKSAIGVQLHGPVREHIAELRQVWSGSDRDHTVTL
jgi:hypothetical protein